MDKFYAPFAKSHTISNHFHTIPLVVYAIVWLKEQIGERTRPKVWQAINILLIAIKVSLFVQDASLILPNFVPYATSLMIFPTRGFNSPQINDVLIRFLYTPTFGKASRLPLSAHNLYIFLNNNKHKNLFYTWYIVCYLPPPPPPPGFI